MLQVLYERVECVLEVEAAAPLRAKTLDVARITCTSMKNEFRGSTEVRSRVIECWPESDEIETNIDLSGINSWNKKKRRKEGE